MGEEGDRGGRGEGDEGAGKCKLKVNEDWDWGDNISPASQCSSDWSDRDCVSLRGEIAC